MMDTTPHPDRHRELPEDLFNAYELAAIKKAVPLYKASNETYGHGGRYDGKTADLVLRKATIILGYKRGPVTYGHVCSEIVRRVTKKRRLMKAWSPKENAKLIAMYRAGDTYHVIGRTLERNVGSIAHQVKKLGMQPRRKEKS